MTWPPYLIEVKIEQPDQRTVSLWLPIFLLWPLFLVIGVIALVLTILVDVALMAAGQRYHYYTFFLIGLFILTAQTRGTSVNVRGDGSFVHVAVR